MTKLKVLQLVEDLKIGGLERVIASIAYGLDRKRYDIEVWCFSGRGDIAEELTGNGAKVKMIDIRSCYNPFSILKLASLFKEYKPDIVHTHTYFGNTIGRVAAKLAGVPAVVTHVHSIYRDYAAKHLLIERFLSVFADKIICCSEAVKDFVVKREKIHSKKVIVIYNGALPAESDNPEDMSNYRKAHGIDGTDIVLSTVASLRVQKGHKYFLDGLAHVVKKHNNVKYLIAGEGPLRKELEEYVDKLGLSSNVVFLGTEKNIQTLLGITDIFVLPSLVEGLSLAAVEAMAYGKPIVASRTGGLPEVVTDSVTGYLVPPEDSEGIARRINELIDDKDKRMIMGAEAKKVFEKKFNIKIMLSRIEGLYEDIIHSKQS